MITFYQYQIDAISWTAQRFLRRLDDKEDKIKNRVNSWLEAIKKGRYQKSSYLQLINLLDMYTIRELQFEHSSIIKYVDYFGRLVLEIVKRTELLDRIVFVDEPAKGSIPKYQLDVIKDLVDSLSVFKSIDTFLFDEVPATFEVLNLVAQLPIKTLCVYSDYVEKDLIKFIQTNQTVEHLEVRERTHERPLDIIKALSENRTLKVRYQSFFTTM